LKMAESTVADRVDVFGYEDARDALRQTAQASAILRAVSLAIDAQLDGSASYQDNGAVRWMPAIEAACVRVGLVRDALMIRGATPSGVDWWTPSAILEATAAALWNSEIRCTKGLSAEEIQTVCDVAIDSLGAMNEALSVAADGLMQAKSKAA
jgi:hypothetical protein